MIRRKKGFPDRVPDGIEPIVGYRLWGYALMHGRMKLHSLNCLLGGGTCPWEGAGSDWVVDWCSRGETHGVPDENCTCGFYALNELPRVVGEVPLPLSVMAGIPIDDQDDTMVLGRVELAGKVIEHEYGYRAERARIAELIPFEGAERHVMRVADQLGLPIGHPVAPPWTDLAPISPRETATVSLSPPEAAIHELVISGSATKEVAESLGLQPGAVRAHLERIFEKLAMPDQPLAFVSVVTPSFQQVSPAPNRPVSLRRRIRSRLTKWWRGS